MTNQTLLMESWSRMHSHSRSNSILNSKSASYSMSGKMLRIYSEALSRSGTYSKSRSCPWDGSLSTSGRESVYGSISVSSSTMSLIPIFGI